MRNNIMQAYNLVVNFILTCEKKMSDYFFEGVEKLLELWFGDSHGGDGSLLDIPRFEWDQAKQVQVKKNPFLRNRTRNQLVKAVNAKIISSIESEEQVHYLLSESSLLISKHRVIIKTCGTTKCLQALKPMMELAMKSGVISFSQLEPESRH